MPGHHTSQRGNIFLALFGAVALVGLLSYGVSQFIRGPLTNATNLTRTNTANQQMAVAGQMIISASALQLNADSSANNGDCDGDSYIEPLPYRDAGADPKPVGGGYIPNTVGATKRDPWGTEYGYCVWDPGAVTIPNADADCDIPDDDYRLAGAGDTVADSMVAVAIISAGKDKTFQTTCNAFVDGNADNLPDNTLVDKTSGTDDLILQFTYGEAQAAGGELWYLKLNSPSVATISKDVEIASGQTLQFDDDARLLIPTNLQLTDADCTGTAALQINEGALRLNVSSSPPVIQSCYDSDSGGGYAWEWGDAGGGGGAIAIDDLTDAATDYSTLYNVFMGSGTGGNSTGAITGTNNTAIGYQALRASTGFALQAGSNTAVGSQALRSTRQAYHNVAIGYRALEVNENGDYQIGIGSNTLRYSDATDNIGIGYNALTANSGGTANIGIGTSALGAKSINVGNIGIGYQAASQAAGGSSMVAIGHQAMRAGGGDNSIAIGYQAGYNANTSARISGIGYQALYSNTSGTDNVAVGSTALYSNVGGSSSTAIGYEAMRYANSSSAAFTTYNTAVGYNALRGSISAVANTGVSNTALGYYTLLNNTWGSNNVAIGAATTSNKAPLQINTTGTSNTAIGVAALGENTTGTNNVAIGTLALNSNVSANFSTAVGYGAMRYANSTGSSIITYNTAVGYQALMGSTTASANTGTSNVAIGHETLMNNTTGIRNIAIGAGSAGVSSPLKDNTVGDNNIAIGSGAMANSLAASQSVAIGSGAMIFWTNTGTPYDSNNVAIGFQALRGGLAVASNTGTSITAIGKEALRGNTSGAGNTAVGFEAGYAGTSIRTGSNNTFVGYQAQADNAAYTNGMALGNGAVLTASNRIVLGNTSIADIYAQVTSITGISDGRKKHDVADIPLGLDFIRALRPVEYRYNNGDDTLRYGFIAQETETALPDTLKPLIEKPQNGLALLTREKDADKTYRMAYGELTAPIVKAIQEQQTQIENLKSAVNAEPAAGSPDDIATLKSLVAAQGETIAALQTKLYTLCAGLMVLIAAGLGFALLARRRAV
jgi:hypothetical protein